MGGEGCKLLDIAREKSSLWWAKMAPENRHSRTFFVVWLRPTSGSIVVEGKEYARLTPQDARSIGIAAIHQELSLFPNLSIAENVHMGSRDPAKAASDLIDRKAMTEDTLDLLSDFFETPVDPNQLVETLSLGERQLVEVAKALRGASTMVILDEPTTSLSLPERRRLFDVARRLRQRGYALIYITHFMEEIYELSDRIVVLRDGRVVGTRNASANSTRRLTDLMVGRELAEIDADLASERREAASKAAAAPRDDDRAGAVRTQRFLTASLSNCAPARFWVSAV